VHEGNRRTDARARRGDGRTGHVRRRGSLLALVLLAATSALGGVASAAFPGLQVVRGQASETSSFSQRAATAFCPPGKVVVGGGGDRSGGDGQVGFVGLKPNDARTTFQAFAAEDQDSFAGNWNITSTAVCANASGLANYQVVTKRGGLDSIAAKGATATCPAGTRVLGAAANLVAHSSITYQNLVLDDVTPHADLTRVSAFALTDPDGVPADGWASPEWAMEAIAICAAPPAGLERVSATSGFYSSDKLAIAECPSGKRLTGVGGEITGGFGEVRMDWLAPIGDTLTVTEGREDQDGTTRNWSATTYGICASV